MGKTYEDGYADGYESGRDDPSDDIIAEIAALRERIDALEWLREVEAYVPFTEHPMWTAAGNSSERGKVFARAEAEHEAILAAARESVEVGDE